MTSALSLSGFYNLLNAIQIALGVVCGRYQLFGDELKLVYSAEQLRHGFVHGLLGVAVGGDQQGNQTLDTLVMLGKSNASVQIPLIKIFKKGHDGLQIPFATKICHLCCTKIVSQPGRYVERGRGCTLRLLR